MDVGLVVELVLLALRMAAVLVGPIMLTVLVVGVVVGALQSATQINEPSVLFVPKVLAVIAVIALTGTSTLTLFVDYLRELIARIPAIAG